MKKAFILLFVGMFVQVSSYAAESAAVQSARQLVADLSESGFTYGDASEYLQNHISASEFNRIATAVENAKFAGTLAQDMEAIARSVQLQAETGSGFHGVHYSVMTNVAIGVGIVVLVAIVLNQPSGSGLLPGVGATSPISGAPVVW